MALSGKTCTRRGRGREALRHELALDTAASWPSRTSSASFTTAATSSRTPRWNVPLPQREKRIPRDDPQAPGRGASDPGGAVTGRRPREAARPGDPRDLLRNGDPRRGAGEPQGRGRRHGGAHLACRPRQGRQRPQRPTHDGPRQRRSRRISAQGLKKPRGARKARASSSWPPQGREARPRPPQPHRPRVG